MTVAVTSTVAGVGGFVANGDGGVRVPTSVLLAVLAAAGLLALAPALVRRYDATERLVAERAQSTARVLARAGSSAAGAAAPCPAGGRSTRPARSLRLGVRLLHGAVSPVRLSVAISARRRWCRLRLRCRPSRPAARRHARAAPPPHPGRLPPAPGARRAAAAQRRRAGRGGAGQPRFLDRLRGHRRAAAGVPRTPAQPGPRRAAPAAGRGPGGGVAGRPAGRGTARAGPPGGGPPGGAARGWPSGTGSGERRRGWRA